MSDNQTLKPIREFKEKFKNSSVAWSHQMRLPNGGVWNFPSVHTKAFPWAFLIVDEPYCSRLKFGVSNDTFQLLYCHTLFVSSCPKAGAGEEQDTVGLGAGAPETLSSPKGMLLTDSINTRPCSYGYPEDMPVLAREVNP